MAKDFKWMLLLAAAVLNTVNALYDHSSDVIELTPTNFQSRVIDSNDVWIVEFFAPWCGHCRNLVPEYQKAAKALKGVVKVGAVNADEHQSLGSQYGVRGFPTIKIFGANKNKPNDYQGQRSAQGFIDAGFRELRNIVDSRIGGGSKSSGSGGSKSNDVIELTESNFDEKVLKSDDLWLVEFYAPWCGHCKNLAPIWAEVATELKGKVRVAAVDATVHQSLASRYEIRGFPTIKVFAAGKKDGSAEEYQGGRSKSDFVKFAMDKLEETMQPPEVVQLTKGTEQLKQACENSQLCILSVLPHILDCQSKCRNEYLDVLRRTAERFKKNRWQYLWMEAGAQPELETALDIGGFGYPAMAVINGRKMKYSLLRGSFSYEGIGEFLRDLLYGRGTSLPLRTNQLPDVIDTEPWDGNDGQMPVIEDIDLSDVDLDTDPKKTEL
ncbi:Protein disulfide-isomerase A6 [Dermatophagoides farinae]|uniref:Protein disulfide-isomerase A6 homolog n=1 Tax=Dermatophagoides farinae TaxID=6954 RepID=A0A922HKF1_DERFA|nr:protein disulfide-isomerase A6 homolog [Dermatophagoides farinae]KAH7639770.1 disulfide-isomerase a6-like protein [Dermatophagoides farinae]KAH9491068.1 Protein disulfide-isomerase A6 [Dermatophagoides farinae]